MNKKGVYEVLSDLHDVWRDYREKNEGSLETHFQTLIKRLGLHPRTLNIALETLGDFGLVLKKEKRYSITELGLYVYPLLKDIEAVLTTRSYQVPFSENLNPRSWCAKTVDLIVGANHQLLLTTRWLSSCKKPELKDDLLGAFDRAASREVDIKMIADPAMPEDIREKFEDKFDAEIRFLPWQYLSKPPKHLKPLFLEDFGHVMIADRRHWLYILPHEKEAEHNGKCCLNSSAIAEYLANIFETFWAISKWNIRARIRKE